MGPGRAFRIAATGIGAAVALTACVGPPSGGRLPEPAKASAAATRPVGGYYPTSIAVAHNGKLRDLVVDDAGFVLYRSDADGTEPPSTACVDACTTKWLPVLTRDTITSVGIDKSLVGSLERPDGTRQVTLGNHPMYRFAGDEMEGSQRGEAVDDVWFAFTATGAKAAGGGGG